MEDSEVPLSLIVVIEIELFEEEERSSWYGKMDSWKMTSRET